VSPWKVILATMVIFGTGVLTGAVVVHYIAGAANTPSQRASFAGRSFEPGSPGGMRWEFLRRTQRDLDLSGEQREQIDKVIKQSQERTRKIMEPVVPQLHQELQRAKAEFRAVLNPAQQERFDELLKLQQRFRERHAPNHPAAGMTNAPATNSI
jgi:Spy/CpxP family protein refolding chaperone